MKAKYSISNLLKDKPMNAGDCARLIITQFNEEREGKKGFLTEGEMISIRDGKKDNPKYYNELLDINQDTQSMTINTYICLLNYKILTMQLTDITDSYVRALYQNDIIGCIEWLEKGDKGIKKGIEVLKSELRHVFVMSTIHVYLKDLKSRENLEDLKNIDIENLRDVFGVGMLKRRTLMNSVLAYQELITASCEKMGIEYYTNKIAKMMDDVVVEDKILARNISILHEYCSLEDKQYDGFLLREREKIVEAVYGEEHQSFLEK